ncbi:MAG: hypothetical protein OEY28_00065 [Nitrospira sp.]|nr:hypothetical protein [Nitrospira sp.]
MAHYAKSLIVGTLAAVALVSVCVNGTNEVDSEVLSSAVDMSRESASVAVPDEAALMDECNAYLIENGSDAQLLSMHFEECTEGVGINDNATHVYRIAGEMEVKGQGTHDYKVVQANPAMTVAAIAGTVAAIVTVVDTVKDWVKEAKEKEPETQQKRVCVVVDSTTQQCEIEVKCVTPETSSQKIQIGNRPECVKPVVVEKGTQAKDVGLQKQETNPCVVDKRIGSKEVYRVPRASTQPSKPSCPPAKVTPVPPREHFFDRECREPGGCEQPPEKGT